VKGAKQQEHGCRTYAGYARNRIYTLLFRLFPQEPILLHSFCTRRAKFAIAPAKRLGQSAIQSKRENVSKRCRPEFSVAGDFLEGESPGEFRFMSSELVPGRCGLLRNPP